MKLQIKPGGAWRDVAEFPPEQLRAVQEGAIALAQALGRNESIGLGGAAWRIIATAARSPKVIGYLEPDKRMAWRKP